MKESKSDKERLEEGLRSKGGGTAEVRVVGGIIECLTGPRRRWAAGREKRGKRGG